MKSLTDASTGASDTAQDGFSLVELLLGTLVSMTALGAVISASLQIGRVRQVDEQLNLAYVACMSNLEDLRALPFADLPSMDGVGFDVPGPNLEPGGLTPVAGDADGQPGQFRVTVDAAGGGTVLYRVAAEVQWSGARGNQEFRMETLIGERYYR